MAETPQTTPSDATPATPPITGPVVEHSVVVAATPQQVWELLTTAEGLSQWYTIGERGGAEIELREGGHLRLWWDTDQVFRCRILRVTEPRRLDYRQPQESGVEPSDDVASTLVQFLITEAPDDPGAAEVTVRESGFDTLADPKEIYTMTSIAWIGALGLLQNRFVLAGPSASPAADGPA